MKKIIMVLFFVLLPLTSHAYSPWLPKPHQFVLNFATTDEWAKQFWLGTTKTDLPAIINIVTLYTGAEYGINEYLAVDALTGFTASSFPGATRGDFQGLADSYVGLRWRLVNEFTASHAWVPTVTLRFGGIIAGTYPLSTTEPTTPPNLQAPGDGLSGGEVTLILGKELPHHFAVTAEVGDRIRESPGPNEVLAGFAVYYTLKDHIIFDGQIRTSQDLTGLDIGRPPFRGTRRDFQGLREIKTYAIGGVGYRSTGGRYVGVEYARVVLGGRNTKQSNIIAAFLSLPLN